ncbi:MAG: chemotaxis-specific protein-glutamate methyltransferase CheB [Silicimonas sp.]|nr:chemotaxis-specific protein-glutamate methyltransferase CheB [Silicimonas sp.]
MADSSPNRPVRVVIVDDTKTIRAMIRALLARSPGIEVVGEAGDPYEAREMIRALDPDVITLDVVMPRMDGLSFLEKVMRLRPMPVIMVSTRTTEKSTEAVRALELGAFDCVDLGRLTKGETPVGLDELVLAAAGSNTRGRALQNAPRPAATAAAPRLNWNGRAVVIGSSTGGVEALMTVISHFPKDCPPTLIAQHMPAPFLESFADRLDRHAAPDVSLARDGGELRQGMVQLAPGGEFHAVLDQRRAPFITRLVRDEGKELYIPSVNVLFSSAVYHGKRITGVMLTGMGRDGAEPMLKMRQAGAHTIAQDAASCVVDGMPKAARTIGAAAEVASLKKIGPAILKSVVRQEQEKIA